MHMGFANRSFLAALPGLLLAGVLAASGCATTGPDAYGSRWRNETGWKVPPDPDCGVPTVGYGNLMITRTVQDILPDRFGIILDGGMFTGHGPLGKDVWFFDLDAKTLRKVGPGCGLPMAVAGNDVLLSCDRQVSRIDGESGAISLVNAGRPLIMAADAAHIAWVTPYPVRQFQECSSAGQSEFALVMCDRDGGKCRTLAALPQQPVSMAFGENEIVMAFGASVGGLWVVGLDEPVGGAGLPGVGIHRDWAAKPTLVTRAGDDYIWYDSATGRIMRHNRQFKGNAYVIAKPACEGAAKKDGFCGVVGIVATDADVFFLTGAGDLVRTDALGRDATTIWSGGLCRGGCSRPAMVGDRIVFIHNWRVVSIFRDGSLVETTDLADVKVVE